MGIKPELKFLFFKVPILLTMWLHGLLKFCFRDNIKDAIFMENFVIAILMFIFAIINIFAFPPDELCNHEDEDPSGHIMSLTTLKEIWKMKQDAKKKKSCMVALAALYNDCDLLDLDGNGTIQKSELQYLCDCAGLKEATFTNLYNAMPDTFNLGALFPGRDPTPVKEPYRPPQVPP